MPVDDLKATIRAAWQGCCDDYNKCRLNSERGLQAAFGFHLRRLIERKDSPAYQVFIEPRIKLADGNTVRPDILICEGENVVVAIKVKYQPRKRAAFKKDLRTLKTLFEQSRGLKFDHCRYCGPRTRFEEFRFSNDLKLVWAGVHADSKCDVDKIHEEMKGLEYQLLRIVTFEEKDAKIEA